MRTRLRKIGILAAALATAASLVLLFTACPNNAGGNTGGGTLAPAPGIVSYPVTFSVEGGYGTLKATVEGGAETAKSPINVEHGKTVTFTAKPDAGYKVGKWTITGGKCEKGGTEGNATAKVKITANTEVKVSFEELPPGSYTIKHYQEGTDGRYPAEPTETENLSGTPETNAAYTPETYTGFTYKPGLTKINGTVQENGTIAADNSTVVELYYERNTVNVTFKLADGNIAGDTEDVVKTGKYGTDLPLPAAPQKTGFVFKGWKPALLASPVFPVEDTQYTADWAPLYTVNFSVDGTGGVLKATAEGGEETAESPITVEHGKTVTFTADHASEYKVGKWEITGGSFEEGGTPGSPTAKVKITADTKVSVYFKSLYEQVAFGVFNGNILKKYLYTAKPHTDGIYYIKVTGLTAEDLKGDLSHYRASELGEVLKNNPTKKVALKLEEIPGLTDMRDCFVDCTSLTQAPVIPYDVTNMGACFKGCTGLTQAPEIPRSVKYMKACFSGCQEITTVTLKCKYVWYEFDGAFEGCKKLTAGSIKVRADQLQTYQEYAYKMGTKVDRFVADE